MKSPGNPSESDAPLRVDPARSAASAGEVSSDQKVNSWSSGGHGTLIALDRGLKWINEKLHVVAAFALFGLAILILVDVLARGAFSSPIAGTAEIVSNAIVAIAFLQLAHSIRCGGFLRVEMLDGVLPTTVRKALFMLACVLGAVLFAAVAYSSWDGMVEAWRIGEFDGVAGSLKVPTAPIRTVVVAASVLAAINFVVVLLRTICFGDIETASEAA